MESHLEVLVRIRGIGEDKMCWTPAKGKGFEVSSHYQALLGVCTQSFRMFLPESCFLFGLQLLELS